MLMRGDLCDEAVWLASLPHDLLPETPEVSGLYASLLLIDSRRATRVDAGGAPVLLADQDRSRWDRAMIAQGLDVLTQAHSRGHGGPYQYQAAIAAVHAGTTTFEATNWEAIILLYDVLDADFPGPLVTLNRTIAVSYARGAEAGLAAQRSHLKDRAALEESR